MWENSSIFSLTEYTSCHQQGHVCSKTSLQQNHPVLNWEWRLTQIDLYNGRKMALCVFSVSGTDSACSSEATTPERGWLNKKQLSVCWIHYRRLAASTAFSTGRTAHSAMPRTPAVWASPWQCNTIVHDNQGLTGRWGSPGFDRDWKNRDPRCKFPPKVQPGSSFCALYIRIRPWHHKLHKLNPITRSYR